jgi:N-acetylglucosaminyl-diphospho-decaprenol L-rhamnosyltransferase
MSVVSETMPLPGDPRRLLVVIVAFNSEAVLDRAVATLTTAAERLLQARGMETALVVVDNASSTPSVPVSSAPSLAVVRLDENIGFAPAANIGARSAPSDLLLFLNPDTALEADALTPLVDQFRDAATAVAGPLLVADDGRAILSERPFHSLRRELRTQLLPVGGRPPFGRNEYETGSGRCLTGACLMVDRRFFESVGGFDESIRMYFEDVELCWRAHAAGRAVRFVTAARCTHGLGAGSGGANFVTRLSLHLTLLAARVEFVRRHYGVRAAGAMRLTIALGAVGRAFSMKLRGGGSGRHTRVFRWAIANGRAPEWDSVRSER